MAQDIAKDIACSCRGSLQILIVPGNGAEIPLASLDIGMVHGHAKVVSLIRVNPSCSCQPLP